MGLPNTLKIPPSATRPNDKKPHDSKLKKKPLKKKPKILFSIQKELHNGVRMMLTQKQQQKEVTTPPVGLKSKTSGPVKPLLELNWEACKWPELSTKPHQQ